MNDAASHAGFPPTRWSLVITAGSKGSPLVGVALEELCQAYRNPLYAYLRRQGKSKHDAEDLVHSFLKMMLERENLGDAQPALGSFRRYLLSCLKHWVINQEVSQKAAKRGGGRVYSFDPEEAEFLCGADLHAPGPDEAYDQNFFRTLIARAMQRLAAEQAARGKTQIFEALVGFIGGADPSDYQTVGGRLGMAPGTVAQTVRRLKARLREFIDDELREETSSAEEFQAERQAMTMIWKS